MKPQTPRTRDHRHHGRWRNMIKRCSNPSHKHWKHYGGKGIAVCAKWRTFEGFCEWADSSGYIEGLELDRRDGSKDYSPDNCQWVTHSENMRNRPMTSAMLGSARKNAALARAANRRPVVCVTNGETYVSGSEACRVLGVNPSNLTKMLKGLYKHTGGFVFRYA